MKRGRWLVRKRLRVGAVVLVGLSLFLLECVPLGPRLTVINASGLRFDSLLVVVRGDTTHLPAVLQKEQIEYRLRPKGESGLYLIQFFENGGADTLEVDTYIEAGMFGDLTLCMAPGRAVILHDGIRGWWPVGFVPALRRRAFRRGPISLGSDFPC